MTIVTVAVRLTVGLFTSYITVHWHYKGKRHNTYIAPQAATAAALALYVTDKGRCAAYRL